MTNTEPDNRAEPTSQKPNPRRTGIALFVFFAGLFLFTTGGPRLSVDDVPRYNLTKAILTQGTIEIPQSLMAAATTVDDRHYSKYGIGMSLVMAPFYVAGRIVERFAPLGLQYAMDRPVDFMMSTTNGWLGALAVALLFALARRAGCRDHTALWIALAAGLSSMVWLYSQTSFENVLVLVLLECALLVLLPRFANPPSGGHLEEPSTAEVSAKDRSPAEAGTTSQNPAEGGTTKPGAGALPLAAAGAAIGFIFLTRWADGWIFLPGLALLLAARLGSAAADRQGRIRLAAAFAAPIALGILLAMVYNYIRFYDPLELGYDDDNVGWRFFFTGLLGFLISPTKSVFLFAPLLIPALAGLGDLGKRLGGGLSAAGFFWLVGAPLFVYSLFENWHGGWCFGPRYLLPSMTLALLGLAGWIEGARWSQALWRPVVFASLFLLGAFLQVVCLGSDFNVYFNNTPPLHFSPEACPLLACPAAFFRPGQNFWVLRLLGWPNLPPWQQALYLVPVLALLAGGWIGLKRELGETMRGARARLCAPRPGFAATVLGVVAVFAALSILRTVADLRPPPPPPPQGAGLTGTWYYNPEWHPPVLKTEVFPQIDFDWARPNRPMPGNFSIRWDGRIDVPAEGDYVFALDACGTATLQVGGETRIVNPGGQPGRRRMLATVHLERGAHPIRVDFASEDRLHTLEIDGRRYERPQWRPVGVTLLWKPPGALFLRPVPARALRVNQAEEHNGPAPPA